jgi:eukaryotic-like serine/threonine-protein kinase
MSGQPRQIGPYGVEREIGRGGMGIVYLGRDPDLGRAVAIKVLPETLASDAERLARLDREAKLLASVSHPNVAGIYGVGGDSGLRYLALEYVPGDTLAVRLARGPLPVREALDVARQIAGGLEAAHDAEVVHRDLKPSNVVLTPTGEVKVLDFGLAKGAVTEISSTSLDASPTVTRDLTSPGVVLGTAAYMSPEQARGKPVDRRADLWALGCILFECLTGRSPFAADTPSDTLARILEREPDWEALPAEVPAKVRDMLRRCLEKDPRSRMRDAGDARLEIEEAIGLRRSESQITAAAAPPSRVALALRRWGPMVALAALAGTLAVATDRLWLAPAGGAQETLHLSLLFPRELRVDSAAPSPDGSVLALTARRREDPAAERQVYLRRLDQAETMPVPGLERAVGDPRFSSDSRWLYAVVASPVDRTELRLMRAPVDGSTPAAMLRDWDPGWGSLLSLRDGTQIVTTDSASGFVPLPASGPPGPTTRIDVGFEAVFAFEGPHAQLDDDEVLVPFQRFHEQGWQLGTALVDLSTGKARVVVPEGAGAVLSGRDRILFARGGNLLAVPFDWRRRELAGPPVSLLANLRIGESWEPGWFRLAANGSLFYLPGGLVGSERRLVTFAPGVATAAWTPLARPFVASPPRVSPDGRQVVVVLVSARALYDLWLVTADGSAQRLVGIADADSVAPVWSPDGSAIAFRRSSLQAGDGVYLQDLQGGAPRLLLASPSRSTRYTPSSFAPDGRRLVITVSDDDGRDLDVAELSLDGGAPASLRPLVETAAREHQATVSPDGRWLSFTSSVSGQDEVYLAALLADGGAGPAQPLSRGRACCARWSPDGRTLYYDDQNGHLLALPLTAEGGRAGDAVQIVDFEAQRLFAGFDVLPDGRLLFVQRAPREGEIEHVEVVLGFDREVARRVTR